jgi:hypothetical protein
MNPSELIAQLSELTQETKRGHQVLYEAEVRLAEAEHALDTVEQTEFIKQSGTIADRTALARLASAENRLQRDLRRAEVNRIRIKIKGLESQLMAVATQAKLIGVEARI